MSKPGRIWSLARGGAPFGSGRKGSPDPARGFCRVDLLEEAGHRCWLPQIEAMAHLGHWQWDLGDAGPFLSAELCRILGKSPGWRPQAGELLGFVTKADRRRVHDLFWKAIECGAAEFTFDCLVKVCSGIVHLNSRVFLRRGRGDPILLGVTQDVSELRNLKGHISVLMHQDGVTNLPNRGYFLTRLDDTLMEARGNDRKVGVVLLDIDHFKDINDAHGHSVGDKLLREAADRLRGLVREMDTLARLGGDEFAIIVADVRETQDMGVIAGRILEALARPFKVVARDLYTSTSVGIAIFPADGDSADALFRHADLALYDAKNHGRATYRFYSSKLTEVSRERDELLADLYRAEAEGALELHFQPKIDLTSHQIVGAEALLRWRHPTRGLLSPDLFIGLAEDSGLIGSMGRWVLENACLAAQRWNRMHGRTLTIAANLSSRQFVLDDLAATVRHVLAATDCRPEWLELEITESLLLGDNDQVRETLLAFREMGIGVAIDDFGTGYSSLSYLKRFPINVLKIDRLFVRDLAVDADSTTLVEGILQMAKGLRMTIVAEGIETDQQRHFLSTHGCHLGQGYLFSRPVPPQEFEALLGRGSLLKQA